MELVIVGLTKAAMTRCLLLFESLLVNVFHSLQLKKESTLTDQVSQKQPVALHQAFSPHSYNCSSLHQQDGKRERCVGWKERDETCREAVSKRDTESSSVKVTDRVLNTKTCV